MSTGQKWWADAYDEYAALLRRFNVRMQGGDGLGGFSLEHFHELERRARDEDRPQPQHNWSA